MNRLISLVLCSAILLCTVGCGKKQDKIEVAEQEVKVSLVTEDAAKKAEEKTNEEKKETVENESSTEEKSSTEKKFVGAAEQDKFKKEVDKDAKVRWVSTGYSFNVDGKVYYCYEVDNIPKCFSEYNIGYETPMENLITELKDVKNECVEGIPEAVAMEDLGEYKRLEFGNYHDSLEFQIFKDKYVVYIRDRADIDADAFYAAVEKYFRINPKEFIELKNSIELLRNGEVDYVSADFKSKNNDSYFSYSLMPCEDDSSEEKQYSHKISYHSKK